MLPILVLCQNANWLFGLLPLPRRFASRQDGVTAEPHDYNRDVQGNTIIVAGVEYFDVEDK